MHEMNGMERKRKERKQNIADIESIILSHIYIVIKFVRSVFDVLLSSLEKASRGPSYGSLQFRC